MNCSFIQRYIIFEKVKSDREVRKLLCAHSYNSFNHRFGLILNWFLFAVISTCKRKIESIYVQVNVGPEANTAPVSGNFATRNGNSL